MARVLGISPSENRERVANLILLDGFRGLGL